MQEYTEEDILEFERENISKAQLRGIIKLLQSLGWLSHEPTDEEVDDVVYNFCLADYTEKDT